MSETFFSLSTSRFIEKTSPLRFPPPLERVHFALCKLVLLKFQTKKKIYDTFYYTHRKATLNTIAFLFFFFFFAFFPPPSLIPLLTSGYFFFFFFFSSLETHPFTQTSPLSLTWHFSFLFANFHFPLLLLLGEKVGGLI